MSINETRDGLTSTYKIETYTRQEPVYIQLHYVNVPLDF